MISKIEAYILECDNCKELFESGEGYTIFIDDSAPVEKASDSGWDTHSVEGKHYCHKCHDINDEDQIVINEKRYKEQ